MIGKMKLDRNDGNEDSAGLINELFLCLLQCFIDSMVYLKYMFNF